MSNMTSMMSRETKLGRGLCIALCGLLLAAALSGCGKKGRPRPPEGEESSYTFPGAYPNPASVLPGVEAEANKSRRVPVHASGITTFPAASRTKTTYGSGTVP